MNNIDQALIKIARVEKVLKKSQDFHSIPDIEDSYTEASARLPKKFKMPHIDRFDGSVDLIVHVRLSSDVLRPMGLTLAQKMSLFRRTLLDMIAIWYTKLEDSTKQNWEELSDGFVNQYSYNTQIEVTINELEETTQNPKEPFIDFVARWSAKTTKMIDRPSEREQVRLPKPIVILPDSLSINAIGEDELGKNLNDWPEQGLNDLAELEEDLVKLEEDLQNLYFFKEEDVGSIQIGGSKPT
ncbi:uncharacterized protein LOC114279096 [Camellia sinensis]|uniref:uncharacterized protein LOC114279096 n=1 Tax=Camellia sinensis TaxID=4442 RepID=UPI0010365608|nr:uncharacterized protein LOC114279096 [Camellia sinensis]